jgi:HPt (histidine-containing phosphotransfer) domain-containing protein
MTKAGIHSDDPGLVTGRHLIADYLEHLGPAATRQVLLHLAASAEALLDRIEPAVAEDGPFRRIAHDAAGALGSLGLAGPAETAKSIEMAPADAAPADLGPLLPPLLALRGRIAGSVMAVLDELMIETRLREVP